MKKILFSFLILALVLTLVGPSSAQAAYAYKVKFTTVIAYQNIGAAAANNVALLFYDSPSDTDPQVVALPRLAQYGATQVGVGSLLSTAFNGTAVLAADQPMAVTLIQTPPPLKTEPRARNRLLSNGFVSGSENVYIPTALKRLTTKKQTTRFTIQNAGNVAVTTTVRFYNHLATQIHTITQNIEPGAGFVVDLGLITAIPNGFNGSVVVEGGVGASLVGGALELDAYGYGAKAFEGIGQGATTVYMPSALCKFKADGVTQTSFYAIQNIGAANADITVAWSNGRAFTVTGVPPLGKASVSGCQANFGGTANPSGFNGAAVITSTQPVAVVGKVSGGAITTAFVGFTAGAQNVAVPFVQYANNTMFKKSLMGRTNLAIQNVSDGPVDITVQYINPDGSVAGTHTIYDVAAGAKVNSNPLLAGLLEFGCYSACTTFGGGARIIATGAVAVLARTTYYVPSTGQRVGEDASGIPIP